MVVTIVIILLVIGLAFLFWPRRYASIKVSQTELKQYFDVLLRRGYHQGFMIVQEPRSQRMVQFSKYIREKDNIGIESAFPLAPWSEPYYTAVTEEVSRANLDYHTYKPDESDGNQVREFTIIDFGQDIEAAFEFARRILTNVFKIAPEKRVRLKFSNVDPRDVRISF
jgi:hypothetical protein